MKKYLGFLIIIFVSVITIGLWILSKTNPLLIISNPLQSLGQITALLGFVLISINLFLSMKQIFLDKFFGGLDRVLLFHRIVGGIGLILLINHPLFFVARDLPDFKLAQLYILPSNDLSYLLGILGLYLMLFSFTAMVFLKLPYHFWKLTHQILGVSFVVAALHSLLVVSDTSRFLPLKIWIIIWGLVGLGSFIYNLLIYKRFGPRYLFSVQRVERLLDIVNIYLHPLGKKLPFAAGQFLYISFRSKTLGRERHPFSISSAPSDPFLRISVKISGDYTLKLPHLEEKTGVMVFGPYGKFGQEVTREQIWVAGGIGVAPFLSLLRQLKESPSDISVSLFYIFKNPEDGVFLPEIQDIAKQIPNLQIYPWCSKEQGRFHVNILSPFIKNPTSTSVLICGPTSMMRSLKEQLIILGVAEEKIHGEDFSFI